MVDGLQYVILKILQEGMGFRVLDIIPSRDTTHCVGVHVLVSQITLGIKAYHFFGPLDELRVVLEHDILKVTHDLGSLALHDHDASPVD